jgi:MoaA/NifB/PqqE/SkfB family radical SAM enzyme
MEVYIISNGSKIPDYIYEKSKKFKRFRLMISIDGIKDKAEYIRYGTKWDIFNSNINNLLKNKIDTKFNIAIQLLNVGYMDEIYKYLIDEKRILNDDIYNCYVNFPEYFDAMNLPFEIKKMYYEKLKKDKNFNLYSHKVIPLLISDARVEKNYKDGMNKLKFFDKIRKNNLLKNFPEFEKDYLI